MTAAYLAPSFTVGQQFFTNQGVILSGGLIYTYQAGTTTPQNTYTDSTATVANANPIVLDSSGRLTSNVWLATGVPTKFVLATSAGTTEGVAQDYVTGVNDPLAVSASTEWTAYALAPTYASTTSFSLSGNQTSLFTVGRRVKAQCTSGLVYGTVTASVYTSLTTITLALDSTLLDSGLSAVSYGFLSDLSAPTPGSVSVLATGSVLAGAGSGPIVAATAAQIVAAIGTTQVTNATNATNASQAVTQASTDNSTNIATTAYVQSATIGNGQSWQNVTSSRAISTTYTNSAGRPIQVSVFATSAAAGDRLQITVGSATVFAASGAYASGQATIISSIIVPTGSTYSVGIAFGSPSITSWSELR